jgi:hypothetical protein
MGPARTSSNVILKVVHNLFGILVFVKRKFVSNSAQVDIFNAPTNYANNFSIPFLIVWIWLDSSLDSLVMTPAEMTGPVTPHARRNASLEGTKI